MADFKFRIDSDTITQVTLEEFQQSELCVGKIISAERVEGSEKLLKLQVDIGEPRQILSGIAKFYTPEQLVGRQVVIIANLEPRMLMGMDLAADYAHITCPTLFLAGKYDGLRPPASP